MRQTLFLPHHIRSLLKLPNFTVGPGTLSGNKCPFLSPGEDGGRGQQQPELDLCFAQHQRLAITTLQPALLYPAIFRVFVFQIVCLASAGGAQLTVLCCQKQAVISLFHILINRYSQGQYCLSNDSTN